MVSKDSMVCVADDKKAGMTMDEIATTMAKARTAGFTVLKKTRVGMRGQIIEMTFEADHGQS